MLAWKRRRKGSTDPVVGSVSTVDGSPGDALTGDAAPPETDVESDETVVWLDEVVSGSVKDVVAYAEEHPELAEQLIVVEQAGKARSSLITQLERIADGHRGLADSSG